MKIITFNLIKKLFIFSLLFNNVFLLRLNSENSNNNKIKEKERSELVGQIYLKGTSEKHKKIQLSTTNSSSKKSREGLKTNTNAKSNSLYKNPASSQPTGNTTKSFDSPILMELWVKYFKYTNAESNIKTPRSFFVNSGYYQQTRLYPNLDDYPKDKDLIQNKEHFNLSIFANSLVFNSSKKV